MRNDDPFIRFAAAGLAILFGLQSAINMAVNLHLMPAKGMTLPFISYGGSSMISLAYGMGMLLALTRERPRAAMLARRDMRARPGVRPDGDGRALVLLAAGGTGGHLFPAEALAAALAKRGVAVDLATDARAARYAGAFPPRRRPCHSRARPSAARNPIVAGARPARVLGYGVLKALADAAAAQAGGRRRLRRLSDHAAAAGREPARHADA